MRRLSRRRTLGLAPPQGLAAGIEVHWRSLIAASSQLAHAAAIVTPEELARAERFRRDADRDAFVLRRAFVRELLAGRLGVQPADVEIRPDSYGKPRLGGSDLGFSLSKSVGLAVVALAPGREIGCDIEWRRPNLASAAAAQLVFSERELADLRATREDQKAEAFFNGWTRKEAVVKAIGLGLSYPLKTFDVSLAPGEPAALLSGPPGWTLAAWRPLGDLHFAVCASA